MKSISQKKDLVHRLKRLPYVAPKSNWAVLKVKHRGVNNVLSNEVLLAVEVKE